MVLTSWWGAGGGRRAAPVRATCHVPRATCQWGSAHPCVGLCRRWLESYASSAPCPVRVAPAHT